MSELIRSFTGSGGKVNPPPAAAKIEAIANSEKSYSGPLIPPSFRIRQKCTAISTVTITGMNTQCST